MEMREQGLQNIIAAMQANPWDKQLITDYNKVKKHVVGLRITATKERIFKSDAQFLMNGDKPTKAFFDRFRNRSEPCHIKFQVSN